LTADDFIKNRFFCFPLFCTIGNDSVLTLLSW